MYVINFLTAIPSAPPSQYFTIEMKKLGWNTTQTNLLTIPKSVLHSKSASALKTMTPASLLVPAC